MFKVVDGVERRDERIFDDPVRVALGISCTGENRGVSSFETACLHQGVTCQTKYAWLKIWRLTDRGPVLESSTLRQEFCC